MEYRNLEIKVISARDLKNVNLISKMDVYVVVSIAGDPRVKKQKTSVDRDGGNAPTWNFPVNFTVDESAARQNRLSLVFTLRCERSLGDKDIGDVHVPLAELLGSAVDDGKTQFLSYQVRKPSGKPKGELNFSYKWGEKVAGPPAPVAAPAYAPPYAQPYAAAASKSKDGEPVTAYPAQAMGASSAYPPPPPGYGAAGGPYGSYPPPPPGGYPPPGYGYPPPQYGGYPPPPQPGYGYPPQQGYGYPPVQQPAKKNNFGLGLGAGLLGGALGGLLIGDMMSDGFGDGGFGDGGFGDGGFGDGGF